MTNYLCEEGTVCNNYQSAICLHCNRRLCILHIAQHNQVNSDNIRNLSHEIVLVTEHINNEYEKTRDIYQTVLVDLAEWRAKQVENITQAYNNYLQHVESQQEALNTLHYELIKKLDDDARKPLEVIQAQQTTGATVLTHIEQTIQIIRDQAAQIHWNVLTLPSVDIRCNLTDTSSTSSNDITLSRQLMTFLLHFFVDHQYISAHQISHWYYNKDINAYTGFDGAKQMTAPFINSFWTDQSNSNVKKSNPMNSTELKHEKMFCIDETE
ncbi:unnamed protein product [Adineta steineri]|uniref:Uncharacterized protein n=1 Tax=Adineta steineri TaxID=433720 RepID=A0A813TVT2_9BILA|nr:unnamed protein product [Adineta steineri]CAF3931874.1 unnamed protein product [Adineta steineri]